MKNRWAGVDNSPTERVIDSTYWHAGELRSRTYPSGSGTGSGRYTVSDTYENAGRLSTVKNGANTLVLSTVYDGRSKPTIITYGNGAIPGSTPRSRRRAARVGARAPPTSIRHKGWRAAIRMPRPPSSARRSVMMPTATPRPTRSTARHAQIAYDRENRPTSVTLTGGLTTTFTYGPDGERLQKAITGGTDESWYLGSDLELVVSAASPTGDWTQYVHPDVKRSGSVLSWLHKDHLSSNRLTSDSTGAAQSRMPYLPYGKPLSAPAVSKSYINERYDAETGLQYLHARYYDPALGRFCRPTPGTRFSPASTSTATPMLGTTPSTHRMLTGIFVMITTTLLRPLTILVVRLRAKHLMNVRVAPSSRKRTKTETEYQTRSKASPESIRAGLP